MNTPTIVARTKGRGDTIVICPSGARCATQVINQ